MYKKFTLIIISMFMGNLLLAADPHKNCESKGFGHWQTESEMPVYHYTGSLPFETTDNMGEDSRLPEDPYFLTGNYKFALFTHVSGIYQLITAQRAWARINASSDRPNYGSASASVTINGEKTELAGLSSVCANPEISQRQFGIGYARYDFNLPEGVQICRQISVMPSEKINDGIPGFLLRVRVQNKGRKPLDIRYSETLGLNYVPMGESQLVSQDKRPLNYPVRGIVKDKNSCIATFDVRPTKFLPLAKEHQNFMYEVKPASVFMYSKDAEISGTHQSLKAEHNGILQSGESMQISIVVGLCYDQNECTDIAGTILSAASDSYNECAFACQWKRRLPNLDSEPDPILRREMLWNAHTIEASAKFNSYYNETFIPQGSVYSYHFGDNISNRDHLQAALGALYYNPELTKSCLRYVMMQSTEDGEISRGNMGYAYTQPSIYKESDPQLYLFNTLGEYLRVTGDYAFLDEEIKVRPAEYGIKIKVDKLLEKHFVYLRDEIGRGPNGLVRLLNSDWADSFLHRYSPNVVHWVAESHLNTAMALVALPKLRDGLLSSGRDKFARAVEEYRTEVDKAFFTDLGDRLFAPRAYLGKGLEFGTDNVCIEPQAYLLQNPTLSKERKARMYEYIRSRISDNETIGVRNREKAIWDPKGGEDCGIWFSLEYPFLLGVASFDKQEAYKLLHKMTFENFSKQYPDYWIGHWTHADEVNSSTYRPGLYCFWIGIDNYRYGLQGYCSHPHCWPLYCYYKLKE